MWQAVKVFTFLDNKRRMAELKQTITAIKRDLEFHNLMLRRLYVAEGRQWTDDSMGSKPMDAAAADELRKESEGIKEVYNKFDLDKSGYIDLTEFHELAGALGTFPPLTDAEAWEVLKQLGKPHLESQLSWKEFLAWWVSGEVLLHDENYSIG